MTGQSKFNRSSASGRTYALTRIAILTSLVSVGRLTFSFIPNVQPMTVLLICITFYYGWKMGLTVALLSVLITNLYLGMGPWTAAQIGGFAALILLSHMFKDSHQNTPLIFFADLRGLSRHSIRFSRVSYTGACHWLEYSSALLPVRTGL